MENLALTTGFMDVNRMTWYLESEKMKELAPFFDGVAPGMRADGRNAAAGGPAGDDPAAGHAGTLRPAMRIRLPPTRTASCCALASMRRGTLLLLSKRTEKR